MEKSLAYVGLLSCMLVFSGCKDSDQQSDQATNNVENNNSGSNNTENNNTGNSNTENGGSENNTGSENSNTDNSNTGNTDTENSHSGSGDTENNAGNGHSGGQETGNSNSGTHSTAEEKVIAVAEEVSAMSLKESLLAGVVDSILYGTEEAIAGVKCKSGHYARSGDVISFNQCIGLYKTRIGLNQFEDVIANGKVTVKSGEMNFQDLVLSKPNSQESRTVTGVLKINENTIQAIISASNISLIEKELINNKLITVNYTLTDYELVHKHLSSTELSLKTKGTLKSVGSAVGDYSIAFKTEPALLITIDPKRNDEFVGYPYAGTLLIEDLNNKSTTVLLSNTDKKTVRYKVVLNDKLLAEGTKNWQQVLGF